MKTVLILLFAITSSRAFAGADAAKTTTSLTPVSAALNEVYPGCRAVPTAFARTVVLDPATQTAAAYVKAGKLQSGDHLILKSGDHGVIGFHQPTQGSGWIWLDFQPGAKAQYIELTSANQVLITGGTFYGPSRLLGLIHFTGGSDFVVNGVNLYGGDATGWNVARWISAPSGIDSDSATCVSVLNSTFINLRMGMDFVMRTMAPDGTVANINGLFKNNVMDGISGDYIHPNGSNLNVVGNTASNSKCDPTTTADANHDDFIQMFGPNGNEGAILQNIQIIDNVFQFETQANASLASPYAQGISNFDACIKNIVVKRNTVLGGAYHMISLSSVDGADIENNTAMNIGAVSGKEFGWIAVGNGRCTVSGMKGSKNVTIKNNVTNYLTVPAKGQTIPNLVLSNNIAISKADSPKAFKVWDLLKMVFDVTPLKGGPLDGKGAGSK